MEEKIFICENCGKEHNGSYGSGRFCSKKYRYDYVYNSKNGLGDLNKKKKDNPQINHWIGRKHSQETKTRFHKE